MKKTHGVTVANVGIPEPKFFKCHPGGDWNSVDPRDVHVSKTKCPVRPRMAIFVSTIVVPWPCEVSYYLKNQRRRFPTKISPARCL